MIDTAMILAAGRGERMRPLTDTCPKPMLPVAGKPLIAHHLMRLAQAGIRRVVINHAWLGHQIEQLGNGSAFGLSISYSPEPEGGLETAGGIVQALPLIDREQFWVLNGDVYCDMPLHTLPKAINSLGHLVLVDNPEHHPQGDFALAANTPESTTGLISQQGTPRYTFSGIAVYQRALFNGLSSNKHPLKPVFLTAIAQQQLSGQYYAGLWCDVGTPERLATLNQQLAKQE